MAGTRMTEAEIKRVFRNLLSAKKAYDSAYYQMMEAMCDSLHSVVITDMPTAPGDHDKIGVSYERREQSVQLCKRYQIQYEALLSLSYDLLECARDTIGISVILQRWMNDDPASWDDIAERLQIDRRSVFRHYSNAIKEMAEGYKNVI